MSRRGGKKKKHWIAGAIKHPGSFTKQAESAGESAGESVGTFAQEHKHDSGTTGNRARLALTLKHMNRK